LSAQGRTVTVHMIGQAHIDPVWLWPWQAGLDEALATCRTACDLLDEHPDFTYTHSAAWTYRQVELADPPLFDRIRAHVASGRWEVVGGWWVQPDCNFPGGIGFERQIGVGKRYLMEKFGSFPEVAYNVDSFGHAATLPGFMRAAGQRFYVMMRPQEHEKRLPARVFRWRGYADGPEVAVFRIAGQYNSGPDGLSEGHVRRALSELPEGLGHTMCFYGVGDHGGGPTARLIEWIRAHRDAFEGARLTFSTPSCFFAAIEGQVGALPLVTGELQFHAIGCYSVRRRIKVAVRRSEHLLAQAERFVESERLETAWQRVAFGQFHDTLGGTSIDSAYPAVEAQLGEAAAAAGDALTYGLRRKMASLPEDPLQRIVLFNASGGAFDGYVEVEPWTQWRGWGEDWRLIGEGGQAVPFQKLPAEALAPIPRLLFRTRIEPGAMRVVRIDMGGGTAPAALAVTVEEGRIASLAGVGVDQRGEGGLEFAGKRATLPVLALIDDLSDNWTHTTDRYPEGPVVSAAWDAPCVLHEGPLMAALYRTGRIGNSEVQSEWRVYGDEPFVELRLKVHWAERQKLLKLVWPLADAPESRLDGIPGSSLQRGNDGREYPLRDWTLCGGAGVVCPDCFALDALPRRLRLTLLRSPYVTHHDPRGVDRPDAAVTDQGVHSFHFRFYLGEAATAQRLEAHALALNRPPLCAELTRGMAR
jgi:alpha-mannosidase